MAARLEGREFYVAEATEIAYDEEFSEDTFRLEVPGVEFRRGRSLNTIELLRTP